MIDILGFVAITSINITAMDYVQKDAYAYNSDHYDVSEYYAKAPTLHVGGYVPVTDKISITFNLNTGTHTKAMTATGSGSLGIAYHTTLKDPSWTLSASSTWSRSADVKHRSCTHGDKYNREFSCGIGGAIHPFSDLTNVKGQWSKPSIQISLTHRF